MFVVVSYYAVAGATAFAPRLMMRAMHPFQPEVKATLDNRLHNAVVILLALIGLPWLLVLVSKFNATDPILATPIRPFDARYLWLADIIRLPLAFVAGALVALSFAGRFDNLQTPETQRGRRQMLAVGLVSLLFAHGWNIIL